MHRGPWSALVAAALLASSASAWAHSASGTLYYTDDYAVISGVSLSTTTGAAATAGDHTITASGGTPYPVR